MPDINEIKTVIDSINHNDDEKCIEEIKNIKIKLDDFIANHKYVEAIRSIEKLKYLEQGYLVKESEKIFVVDTCQRTQNHALNQGPDQSHYRDMMALGLLYIQAANNLLEPNDVSSNNLQLIAANFKKEMENLNEDLNQSSTRERNDLF